MKKIKQKKDYVAPELTVLRFRQERGYAGSLSITGVENSGDYNLESREDVGSNWGGLSDGSYF